MFAGPNGSGKTTLYEALILKGEFRALPYVNADAVQRLLNEGVTLSGSRPWEEAAALAGWLATSELPGVKEQASHLQLGDDGVSLVPGRRCDGYLAAALADWARRRHAAAADSFAFETVMSHESKVDLLADLQAKGFHVYLYFVATEHPSLNVLRVQQRVDEGGHGVPLHKIVERYDRCVALLPNVLRVCKRAFLFDSSSAPADRPDDQWVAEYDGGCGVLTPRRDPLPGWVPRL